MSFYDRYVELCREKGKYPQSPEMLEAAGVKSPSVTNWKKKDTVPKADVLARLSMYFDVSVDYLLGNTDEKKPKDNISDLKVALFGGDAEVTEEMWDEVYQFAQFVKQKNANKKAPDDGSNK